MNELFAVYGAEGCGRSLMPVANEYLKRLGNNSQIVFIDDALEQNVEVNGHIAMNYQHFKNMNVTNKFVLIAIANSDIRQQLVNKLVHDGIALWSVQATSTLIMESAIIDEGAALRYDCC